MNKYFERRCSECKYEPESSCWGILSDAEKFGIECVEGTYRELRNKWDGNCKFLTELTVILNEKGLYYLRRNIKMSNLYTKLFHETYLYAEQHLVDNEKAYFYSILAKFNM